MNERQYNHYKELMKLSIEQRIQLANKSTGEVQLILSYDPREEVLEGLLDNPQLSPQCLLHLARRRNLPVNMLEKIADNHSWISQYNLKFEVVRNPRTPAHVALKIIKFLYRKELQALARDVSVTPTIRHTATSLLEARLSDLLPGEKIALAREAVGPILRLLLKDDDAQVITAALQNNRLRENDVVMLAHRQNVAPEVLAAIFHSKWIRRYQVKIALAYNPDSPSYIEREAIKSLLQQDLQELIANTQLPMQKRMCARHVLRSRINALPFRTLKHMAIAAPREIINILIEKEDVSIIQLLEQNPHLAEGHMVSLAVRTSSLEVLTYLVRASTWRHNSKIQQAISHNPNTPPELLSRRNQSEGS